MGIPTTFIRQNLRPGGRWIRGIVSHDRCSLYEETDSNRVIFSRQEGEMRFVCVVGEAQLGNKWSMASRNDVLPN